jgi:TonB family protein
MDTSLAIAGLNPAKAPDFTPPAGSQQAGFSAGPEIHPNGGTNDKQQSSLVIPGLLARGASKDSQPTLVAGVLPVPQRNVTSIIRAITESPVLSPESRATRVSNAPDPRLEGRAVYSIAIQMPNLTSYYGSWLVWFAERDRAASAAGVTLTPPTPTRKVDPKYIPAAASERIEGVVRLFAIIRKDGSIDALALIRHLDDRLDRSAYEALSKWRFEPALRDGVPIDVDTIFEIPFHLAPRTAK